MKSLKEQIKKTSRGGILELKYGTEFSEQLIIKKPITIRSVSSPATIVGSSPTITIQSSGVILENLNIVSNDSAGISLFVKKGCEPVIKELFVKGKAEGLENEQGDWDIPDLVELGSLEPNKAHQKRIMIRCPVPAMIYPSDISVVHCKQKILVVGINEIDIIIDEIPKNSLINGDLIIETTSYHLKRRISLTGNTLNLEQASVIKPDRAERSPAKEESRPARVSHKSSDNQIRINLNPLKNLPQGTQFEAYQFILDEELLKCKGYDIFIKGLPEGLIFDNSIIFRAIKGIPQKAGEFQLTFEFQKDSQKYTFVSTLKINQSACEINSAILKKLPEGTEGKTYEFILDESRLNSKGYKIRIKGLPDGLFFESTILFQIIKGIPKKAGEFELTFEFEKEGRRYQFPGILKIAPY